MSEPDNTAHEPMEDPQDELRCGKFFARTQPPLSAAARHVKQQIAAGMATPMDYNQL